MLANCTARTAHDTSANVVVISAVCEKVFLKFIWEVVQSAASLQQLQCMGHAAWLIIV